MAYDKKDPKLISGTQLANKIKAEAKEMVQELKEKHGLVPKLATVFPFLDCFFWIPTAVPSFLCLLCYSFFSFCGEMISFSFFLSFFLFNCVLMCFVSSIWKRKTKTIYMRTFMCACAGLWVEFSCPFHLSIFFLQLSFFICSRSFSFMCGRSSSVVTRGLSITPTRRRRRASQSASTCSPLTRVPTARRTSWLR